MLSRSYMVALALVAACQIPDVTFTKPPSCVNLASICGASGADSCCNTPEVPGGTYFRNYDLSGDGLLSGKIFPATVDDFRLDKYVVTVGRFRAFVNAGMGTQSSPPLPGSGAHANIAGSGWDTSWNTSLVADKAALIAKIQCDSKYLMWTDTPEANENRPMNCVTWYEAMAFCAWDGGYLATAAEWNYAATGGDQQRAFPWSQPAGALTPLDSSHASYDCMGDGMAGCAATDLVAVGTKSAGDGRWGHSDLSGNVWEWTLDWSVGYSTPCVNCADLAQGPQGACRGLRGGSFDYGGYNLRAGYRSNCAGPAVRSNNFGIRCARASDLR